MKIIEPGPSRQPTLSIRRATAAQQMERSIQHLIHHSIIPHDSSPSSEYTELLRLCHGTDADRELLFSWLAHLNDILYASFKSHLSPSAFRLAIDLLNGPLTLLVPEEELAIRREKLMNPPSRIASPPQPNPPSRTFHPFPRLPAELRLAIYELAFRGDLQPKIHFLLDRHGWRHDTEVELVSHLRASDEKHYSRIGYVCREARAFWLFRTELVWAFGTWVNWSRDGFWIDDRMGVKEVGVSLRGGDEVARAGIGMDGSHASSTGSEEDQGHEIFLTPNAYAHILSQPGISQIQNLILRRRILLNNPLPGNFLVAWGKFRGCLPRMRELWVVMNENRGVEEIKREGELRFRALKARERRAWRDVAYVRAFVQALRGGVELSRGGRKETGQCEHGMVLDDSEKVKVDFVLVGTRENGGEDAEIEFVRRIRYPGGRVF